MAALPQRTKMLMMDNLLRLPRLSICVVGKQHLDWTEFKQLEFWTHVQGFKQMY